MQLSPQELSERAAAAFCSSFRSNPAFAAPALQPHIRRLANEDVSMDDGGDFEDEVAMTDAATHDAHGDADELSLCEDDAAGDQATERWPELQSLYEDTQFPELNVWAAMAAEQRAEEQRASRRPPLTVQNSAPRALGKRPSHELTESAAAREVKRFSVRGPQSS
eukprot:1800982-Prymnesium_polylepis.1